MIHPKSSLKNCLRSSDLIRVCHSYVFIDIRFLQTIDFAWFSQYLSPTFREDPDFLTEVLSEISQKFRQWCNELVPTIFKTFCAVFICILILAFYGVEITKEQVLARMLAIYLVKKCLKLPPFENLSATEYLLYQIRDCAVQRIVSLMGYVLLGFHLGKDSLTLDLNTAAIGIGTAVSRSIRRLPGLLEHFTQDNKSYS